MHYGLASRDHAEGMAGPRGDAVRIPESAIDKNANRDTFTSNQD